MKTKLTIFFIVISAFLFHTYIDYDIYFFEGEKEGVVTDIEYFSKSGEYYMTVEIPGQIGQYTAISTDVPETVFPAKYKVLQGSKMITPLSHKVKVIHGGYNFPHVNKVNVVTF